MIVIAAHDRIDLLAQMLKRLKDVDLNKHEILVVDTNSTNKEFLNGIVNLINEYPGIKFERKAYTCWDSGAFIHGYRNYRRARYIFLQDSIYIKNPNLIVELDAMLDVVDVAAIIDFKYGYQDETHRGWVEEDLGDITSWPERGIFGSMFAVRRSALDKLFPAWLNKQPLNKVQAIGMERRWSLMFHLTNASKKYMHHIPDNEWDSFYNSENDKFNITKYWMNRDNNT